MSAALAPDEVLSLDRSVFMPTFGAFLAAGRSHPSLSVFSGRVCCCLLSELFYIQRQSRGVFLFIFATRVKVMKRNV